MELKKMMGTNMINLNVKAHSKKEAIKIMSQMLLDEGRISSMDAFIGDVFRREDIETTNMDMGVAIPHSQASAIEVTSIVLARLDEEINWEDYGEPVKIIFLLAVSPNDKGVEHLEVISRIAELLIDQKFIKFLRSTKNPKKLLRQMNKLIGG